MSGGAFAVTHHPVSSWTGGTADRNRSHWSTKKTPSYTKSVSWQHHQKIQRESGTIAICHLMLYRPIIFSDWSQMLNTIRVPGNSRHFQYFGQPYSERIIITFPMPGDSNIKRDHFFWHLQFTVISLRSYRWWNESNGVIRSEKSAERRITR